MDQGPFGSRHASIFPLLFQLFNEVHGYSFHTCIVSCSFPASWISRLTAVCIVIVTSAIHHSDYFWNPKFLCSLSSPPPKKSNNQEWIVSLLISIAGLCLVRHIKGFRDTASRNGLTHYENAVTLSKDKDQFNKHEPIKNDCQTICNVVTHINMPETFFFPNSVYIGRGPIQIAIRE